MRTSQSHPLQIAEIPVDEDMGSIGITFCPGKKQPSAATGAWDRDLDLDVAAIAQWNAAAVVTLLEDHELEGLRAEGLGDAVRAAHMAWYHLPIPDAHPPGARFEQAWLRAGRDLRDILRSGFNVLVHCKGGLGRAGTVAARLLIELGWDEFAASAEVRSVRPGAIETPAQHRHVNSTSRVVDGSSDKSEAACRDRALGAMLGLAVGDALGTTLEFSARDTKPRVTELVGGGPFDLEPGQWTDDTAMALAMAESVYLYNGIDERDVMERFVSWHETGEYSPTGTCFDIGATISAALRRFKATGNPVAGSTAPMCAGNGSLMRLAPVAIHFWDDEDKRRDAAARQSRLTHGAPEAVGACIAYADLIAEAIAGAPKSEVLAPRKGNYAGRIAGIMAGSWRGTPRSAIRSSSYVAHSLEAALWCVGRTGSYADAVILAANLGEDADTTAAITGQLAGALYGTKDIPSEWLEKLAWYDRLKDAAGLAFNEGE